MWQAKYPFKHRQFDGYIARIDKDENGNVKYFYTHTDRGENNELTIYANSYQEFLWNWEPKGVILNRRF